MKKTSFTFIPPHCLFEEIDPHLLSRIISSFLSFADKVEKGLNLPDRYGLMWALKWNKLQDSPTQKSVFAKVSLCTTENPPRALDEFIQLIQITENSLDTFGQGSPSVDHIVDNIIEELSSVLEKREGVLSDNEQS